MRQIKLDNTKAVIFPDLDQIWDFMLSKWRELAKQAIEEHGVFNVAVAGGSTPLPFYKKLGEAKDLPWDRTNVFLTDERVVPLDHPDSNYAAITNQGLTLPFGSDPSAKEYEQKLRTHFNNTLPSFDLILLGIGDDGHIASLFPQGPELDEKESWVVSASNPNHKHPRTSLTLSVINNAKHIWFLVTGKKKADVVKEIFVNHNQNLPASLVDTADVDNILIVDEDAAGKIR